MQLETNSQGFTEWGWIEFGLKSYYAYLNCGFRMMPSAGTGSGVHPVPLGFGRVYVQVPGEFTYEKWRQGLLAGRSFVTTGPMLRLTFNGESAGHCFTDVRNEPTRLPVRVQGTVESLSPIDRIEFIVNGNVVNSITTPNSTSPAGKPQRVLIDETIVIEGSGWLAIRCFEARADRRIRFAHSAPVFVDVPRHPQHPFQDEVQHFVERIEREIARNRETLTPDAMEEYQEALSIYRELRGHAIERRQPKHSR